MTGRLIAGSILGLVLALALAAVAPAQPVANPFAAPQRTAPARTRGEPCREAPSRLCSTWGCICFTAELAKV